MERDRTWLFPAIAIAPIAGAAIAAGADRLSQAWLRRRQQVRALYARFTTEQW